MINAGDRISVIDGVRASQSLFLARLDDRKPGDLVHLTIFRGDDLRCLDVKLGARSVGNYRVVPVARPTDDQRRIYQAWLGASLEAR